MTTPATPRTTTRATDPVCEAAACWAGASVLDPGRSTRRGDACTVRSSDLRDRMVGRAGHATAWLAVEHTGPWGRDVVTGTLDGPLAGVDLTGVRTVLVRRSAARRPAGAPLTVLLARSGGPTPWVRRLEVGGLDELAGVVRLLGDAPPAEGEAPERPVVLVCTHGRRDACCAEFGRPVHRTLRDHPGADVWEATHVGGDRFAANLVILPEGLHYSRLTPSTAAAPVEAYLRGRLDLPHFRGRSTRTMAEQAAEHAVRVELGVDRIEALATSGHHTDGDEHVVTVTVGGQAYLVSVREQPVAPGGVLHGCTGGAEPATWRTWTHARIERLEPGQPRSR
ncbi:sucrase ferredoxin [Nocardioides zeae]|uniref:Sucrase ferredoxin n=1 Tax=Nocardioides imazamoxiresistens TaxID=3231893 RepID=A0ABU3PRS7_9ACTN|nr:sucrase ferredoxin [Nocardioides zeae]MDT9591931.1 sucrase ferredoxin [Nocardioides zeae]